MIFHRFKQEINPHDFPDKFTNPFDYQPHPLCLLAAEEIKEYLSTQAEWAEELAEGKMFGVLIVQNSENEIGYVSAFSGNLAHSNYHPFFVPPVYDLLNPDGFFVKEEAEITAINHQINELANHQAYIELKRQFAKLEKDFVEKLAAAKEKYQNAQKQRNRKRAENPDAQQIAEMTGESQFQKAEIKRLKQKFIQESNLLRLQIADFEERIEKLKNERKAKSNDLQKRLFDQFLILNSQGEEKGLNEIFEKETGTLPPSGAGECAAPKMLQYAFANHLKPLAMAEFWYGKSPKNEIRRHGNFYPACKNKCEPILKFMLQGVDIENISAQYETRDFVLETVFEDDWILVVNKPAGMLCVPGKIGKKSVYMTVKEQYPEASGSLLVHRLDMDTSGLMLIAKTSEVHKILQKEFATRAIEKTYIAILDGLISEREGIINLPLIMNPADRPRQVVSNLYGKEAITKYKVLKEFDNKTYIELFPITGRTHQLRVHVAHPDGLNAPIVGDRLYGKPADRLYLQAKSLAFRHPVTSEYLNFTLPAAF
ncbi:MAG: RNA pseudouridine synthase [Tannerella sp.]|jgi:tRNA pseudouridine32 synthase/23S rRNA pseudouridine746 synthase|nr:RNA pseudouridine synthase [Tannerella sp.]